ncbi:unnamed protein product [Victoria cruziana]
MLVAGGVCWRKKILKPNQQGWAFLESLSLHVEKSIGLEKKELGSAQPIEGDLKSNPIHLVGVTRCL